MSKDYYKTLGVDKNASKEEIKQAFRKLAHQHHPDKGGDEKKFKEINEAYSILSNDEKRQQYDQFGSDFSGFTGQGGMSWEDIFRNYQSQGQNVEFDLGDIFGGGGGFSNIFSQFFNGGGRTHKARKEKGKDIVVDLEISLEEAFSGVVKEINLKKYNVCKHCKGTGGEPGSGKKKCSECDGQGQVQQTKRTFFGTFSQVITCSKCFGEGELNEKECKECKGTGRVHEIENIKIDLPAGVDNEQTIKIPSKGEAAKKGGVQGDLYVRVHLKQHEYFTRKRDDLYCDAEIKYSQAVLGDKINILTMEGDLQLKIPAGTEAGKMFRLSGKGMPRLNSYGHGDQYVKIHIKVPHKLSRKQEELIERLKEEEL
ncbi:MAG TPA: molecular chaperone DnaJ [Candidatus Portnoybacteria bacterium]|jgi:molecular chaperone DnaJ|nr:molecular chaperone DnaJ [Candidatus Portnoybacteria bacterium]HOZ16629.1 molecular chaperone DnaJ [Candidatus Portnoybacteria bacterium]HPH52161.1 molecular chaperone DnaJ [Candidatus Portnoybacteria bacterium]HPM28335.1 molecular chaperone DnaJ [Candidatus Portnoybacteria bacterium]